MKNSLSKRLMAMVTALSIIISMVPNTRVRAYAVEESTPTAQVQGTATIPGAENGDGTEQPTADDTQNTQEGGENRPSAIGVEEGIATIADATVDNATDFVEAIEAAKTAGSGTITLSGSFTVDSIIVTTGNITINLGTYTLTGSGNQQFITNRGTLTIKGSDGSISSNASTCAIENISGCTLNINNANVINTAGDYCIYNYGTVKINGSTITSSSAYAIWDAGTSQENEIKNASVLNSGENKQAIVCNNSAKYTLAVGVKSNATAENFIKKPNGDTTNSYNSNEVEIVENDTGSIVVAAVTDTANTEMGKETVSGTVNLSLNNFGINKLNTQGSGAYTGNSLAYITSAELYLLPVNTGICFNAKGDLSAFCASGNNTNYSNYSTGNKPDYSLRKVELTVTDGKITQNIKVSNANSAGVIVAHTADGGTYIYGYNPSVDGKTCATTINSSNACFQANDGKWVKLGNALLWTTNWADNTNYGQWGVGSMNTAEELLTSAGALVDKQIGTNFPENLDQYNLVWLHLPAITADNYTSVVNMAAIRSFLARGGRVVIQTEVDTMMAGYNEGVSALAQALGGGFTVNSSYQYDTNNAPLESSWNTSSFVGNIGKVHDWGTFIPLLTMDSTKPVQWVAKQGDYVFIAEQPVEKGRLTIMGDFNWYYNPYNSIVNEISIKNVFKQLWNNTQANIATVASGQNPNDGFGIINVNTFQDLQAAIDNGDLYIKLTGDISAVTETDSVTGITISANSNVTIDLNGHSITVRCNDTNENKGYAITNNGNLTVINTSDTAGAIVGSGKGIVNTANASLTVQGDSKGYITVTGEHHQGIEVGENTTVSINKADVTGGFFAICDVSNGTSKVDIENANLINNSENCTVGVWQSTGGTYSFGDNVTVKNKQITDTTKLIDKNNIITASNSVNYEISYKPVMGENNEPTGRYTIVKTAKVTSRAELQNSINSGEFDKIALDGDIQGGVTVPAGVSTILDLNGYTINGQVTNNGTLTVTDTSAAGTGAITAGAGIVNSGVLTVEAGTIVGTTYDGIQNTSSAQSVIVGKNAVVQGRNYAICDYGTNSENKVEAGATLICAGGDAALGVWGNDIAAGKWEIKPGVIFNDGGKGTSFLKNPIDYNADPQATTIRVKDCDKLTLNKNADGTYTVAEKIGTITLGAHRSNGAAHSYTFPDVKITGEANVYNISVDSGYFTFAETEGCTFASGVISSADSDAVAVAGKKYKSVQITASSAEAARAAVKAMVFTKTKDTDQNVTVTGMKVNIEEGDVYFGGHIYELSADTMKWRDAMTWSLNSTDHGDRAEKYTGFTPTPIAVESIEENNVIVNFYNKIGKKNIWLSAVPKHITNSGEDIKVTKDSDGKYTVTVVNTENLIAQGSDRTDFSYRWLMDENSTLPAKGSAMGNAVWYTAANNFNGSAPNNGGVVYLGFTGAYWDDFGKGTWDGDFSYYAVTEWIPSTTAPAATSVTVKDSDLPPVATTLAELQDIIDEAKAPTNIILGADIDVTNTVEIPAGKDITISGGKDENGNTYTIKRAGADTADTSDDFKGVMLNVTGGALTLNDVVVDGGAVWTAGDGVNPANRENTGIVVNDQMIEVHSGALTLGNGAVLQNNHFVDNRPEYADDGSAIYFWNGTLTMDDGAVIKDNTVSGYGGGTLTGDGAAISVWGGTATISGTITGNYAPRMGGAIRITDSMADGAVTFKDVTITDNYCSVAYEGSQYEGIYGAVCLQKQVNAEGKVVIDGNYTVSGNTKTESNVALINSGAINEVDDSETSGNDGLTDNSLIGIYSTVNNTVGKGFEGDDVGYFSLDNSTADNTGIILLIEDEIRVYESLEAAIAAQKGEPDLGKPVTIRLTGNVAGPLTIPVGANITLDLNGHTIGGNVGTAIYNYGTLTINDTSEDKTGTVTGTGFGVVNCGNIAVNGGTINGTNHEGISNTDIARGQADTNKIVINGGTIQGRNYAICDYVEGSQNELNGGTLIRTGYGNGYVVGGWSEKGGNYTIGNSVTPLVMQNTVPGKYINTAGGDSEKVPQVAVENYELVNFAETNNDGKYTATVTVLAADKPFAKMELIGGDVYYTIKPAYNNTVRFDFQFYAANNDDPITQPTSTRAPAGFRHLCFVKSNYTDGMTSRGVTQTAPRFGAEGLGEMSFTFTGKIDLAQMKPYSGNAVDLNALGAGTPYLWVSVNPCYDYSSDYNDITWICLGKFDSWAQATRADITEVAAEELLDEIKNMNGMPTGDILSQAALKGKIEEINNAVTAVMNSPTASQAEKELANAKGLAQLEIISTAAKLAQSINSNPELTADEKADLLAKANEMMETALAEIEKLAIPKSATEEQAIDYVESTAKQAMANTAVKMAAKAQLIEKAAQAIGAISATENLGDKTTSTSEMAEAIARVNTALTKGISAIDGANGENDTIISATSKAVATMDVEMQIAVVKDEILANPQLTQEDKTALVDNADDIRFAATEYIKSEDVSAELEKLTAKIEVLENAVTAYETANSLDISASRKTAAKSDVLAELKNANGSINDGIIENYVAGEIDKETGTTAVDSAKWAGITAIYNALVTNALDTAGASAEEMAVIEAIITQAQSAVKNAKDDETARLALAQGQAKIDAVIAAAQAKAEINSNPELTNADKTELTGKIEAVKKATIGGYTVSTVDGKTTVTFIDTDIEKGTIDKATAGTLPLEQAKTQAEYDLVLETAKAYGTINSADGADKTTVKDNVQSALAASTEKIKKANNVAEINQAKLDGIQNITDTVLSGILGAGYTAAERNAVAEIIAQTQAEIANAPTERAKALASAKGEAKLDVMISAIKAKDEVYNSATLTEDEKDNFIGLIDAAVETANKSVNTSANTVDIALAKAKAEGAAKAVATATQAIDTINSTENLAGGTDGDKATAVSAVKTALNNAVGTVGENGALTGGAINNATTTEGVNLATTKTTTLMDVQRQYAQQLDDIKASIKLTDEDEENLIDALNDAKKHAMAEINDDDKNKTVADIRTDIEKYTAKIDVINTAVGVYETVNSLDLTDEQKDTVKNGTTGIDGKDGVIDILEKAIGSYGWIESEWRYNNGLIDTANTAENSNSIATEKLNAYTAINNALVSGALDIDGVANEDKTIAEAIIAQTQAAVNSADSDEAAQLALAQGQAKINAVISAAQAKAEINANTELSPEEKQALTSEIDTVKNTVAGIVIAEDGEITVNEGTIGNATTETAVELALAKTNAKYDLIAEKAEAYNKINGLIKSDVENSEEKRAELKAKIDKVLEGSKPEETPEVIGVFKNIDSATTVSAVETEKYNGIKDITQAVFDAEKRAELAIATDDQKALIEAKYDAISGVLGGTTTAISNILGNSGLSDSEKEMLVAQLEKAQEAAIAEIETAYTDENKSTEEKTDAIRLAKGKALQTAQAVKSAAEQIAEIKALPALTSAQKSEAVTSVKTTLNTAVSDIEKANDIDGAQLAATKATAVMGVETQTAQAVNDINTNSQLTAADKATLIEMAETVKETTVDNINDDKTKTDIAAETEKARAKFRIVSTAANSYATINSLDGVDKSNLKGNINTAVTNANTTISDATAGDTDAETLSQAKWNGVQAVVTALVNGITGEQASADTVAEIRAVISATQTAVSGASGDKAKALENAKGNAKINAVITAAQAKAEINANTALSPDEKAELCTEIDTVKNIATGINKDENGDITVNDGTIGTATTETLPLVQAKTNAKYDLTVEKADAYGTINGMDITSDAKSGLKTEIDTAIATANTAVTNAQADTDNGITALQAVATAENNGIQAVADILLKGELGDDYSDTEKSEIRKLIEETKTNVGNAATEAEKALAQAKGDAKLDVLISTIRAQNAVNSADLSDSEKAQLISKINAAQATANGNIDRAKQIDIITAAAEKAEAKNNVVAQGAQAKAEINKAENLTTAEAKDFNNKLDTILAKAQVDIDKANNTADIALTAEKTMAKAEVISAGVQGYNSANSMGNDTVKSAIDTAVNTALGNTDDTKSIDKQTDVTGINTAKQIAVTGIAQAVAKTATNNNAENADIKNLVADTTTRIENATTEAEKALIQAKGNAKLDVLTSAITAESIINSLKDKGLSAPKANTLIAEINAVKTTANGDTAGATGKIDSAETIKSAQLEAEKAQAKLNAIISAAQAIADINNSTELAAADKAELTGDINAVKAYVIGTVEDTGLISGGAIGAADTAEALAVAQAKADAKYALAAEKSKAYVAINGMDIPENTAATDDIDKDYLKSQVDNEITAANTAVTNAQADTDKDTTALQAIATAKNNGIKNVENVLLTAMLGEGSTSAESADVENLLIETQTAVDNATTRWDKALETAKGQAKLDAYTASVAAKAQVNGTDLSDKEKADLIDKIDREYAKAIEQINSAETPAQAQLATDKAQAKNDVIVQLAEAKSEIAADKDLTASEAKSFNSQVDSAVNTALNAIDGATSAETAEEKAEKAVAKIEIIAEKAQAYGNINAMGATADKTIELKNAVYTAATAAQKAIDGATAGEGITLTDAINNAKVDGITNITKAANGITDASTLDTEIDTVISDTKEEIANAGTDGEKALAMAKGDAKLDVITAIDTILKDVDNSGLKPEEISVLKQQIGALKSNAVYGEPADGGNPAISGTIDSAATREQAAAEAAKAIAKAELLFQTAVIKNEINSIPAEKLDAAEKANLLDIITAAEEKALGTSGAQGDIDTATSAKEVQLAAAKADAVYDLVSTAVDIISTINNMGIDDDVKSDITANIDVRLTAAVEKVNSSTTESEVSTERANGISTIINTLSGAYTGADKADIERLLNVNQQVIDSAETEQDKAKATTAGSAKLNALITAIETKNAVNAMDGLTAGQKEALIEKIDSALAKAYAEIDNAKSETDNTDYSKDMELATDRFANITQVAETAAAALKAVETTPGLADTAAKAEIEEEIFDKLDATVSAMEQATAESMKTLNTRLAKVMEAEIAAAQQLGAIYGNYGLTSADKQQLAQLTDAAKDTAILRIEKAIDEADMANALAVNLAKQQLIDSAMTAYYTANSLDTTDAAKGSIKSAVYTAATGAITAVGAAESQTARAQAVAEGKSAITNALATGGLDGIYSRAAKQELENIIKDTQKAVADAQTEDEKALAQAKGDALVTALIKTEQAKAEIAANGSLTPAEKQALTARAENAYTSAKAEINNTDTTTSDKVALALAKAEAKCDVIANAADALVTVDSLNPDDTAAETAKARITSALDTAIGAIDTATDTPAVAAAKAAAKTSIATAVTNAVSGSTLANNDEVKDLVVEINSAIDSGNELAIEKGTAKLDIIINSQNAADAVAQAQQAGKLTDGETAELTSLIDNAVAAANAKINSASSAEDVEVAAEKAKATIAAVKKARQAMEEIRTMAGLTDKQKETAEQAVKAALEQAVADINNAATAPRVQLAGEKATAIITAELWAANALAAINTNPQLTQADKNKLTNEVNNAKENSITSIENSTSSGKAQLISRQAQAENALVETVARVYEAINALKGVNKAAVKNAVQSALANGKADIANADNSADVTTAQLAATQEILQAVITAATGADSVYTDALKEAVDSLKDALNNTTATESEKALAVAKAEAELETIIGSAVTENNIVNSKLTQQEKSRLMAHNKEIFETATGTSDEYGNPATEGSISKAQTVDEIAVVQAKVNAKQQLLQQAVQAMEDITAMPYLTDAQKADAKSDITATLDDAIQDIDNANLPTQVVTVFTGAQTAIAEIVAAADKLNNAQKPVPSGKPATGDAFAGEKATASAQNTAAAAQAKAAVNSKENVSPQDKAMLTGKINSIEKSTAQAIINAATSADVALINAKANAKYDIIKAAATALDNIGAMTGLTDRQKALAKDGVIQALDDTISAIDNAATASTVAVQLARGKNAINSIVHDTSVTNTENLLGENTDDAKTLAKEQVANHIRTAENTINAMENISDADRQALIAIIQAAGRKARATIDGSEELYDIILAAEKVKAVCDMACEIASMLVQAADMSGLTDKQKQQLAQMLMTVLGEFVTEAENAESSILLDNLVAQYTAQVYQIMGNPDSAIGANGAGVPTGLLIPGILILFAGFWWFFIILWKRRKDEEEEEQISVE